MSRRLFPDINSARAFPKPNTDRTFPLPLNQVPAIVAGQPKEVELGQLSYPFAEFSIEPSSDLSQLEWDQDGGGWNLVSAGSFVDVIAALKMGVSFTPTVFNPNSVFSARATMDNGSQFVHTVGILSRVFAGRDKIANQQQSIRPFADARFAIDDTLLNAVKYEVEGEVAKTDIPASFGSDLITRVKNFEISFSTLGTKVITLYVTDKKTPTAQELSDVLVVEVAT